MKKNKSPAQVASRGLPYFFRAGSSSIECITHHTDQGQYNQPDKQTLHDFVCFFFFLLRVRSFLVLSHKSYFVLRFNVHPGDTMQRASPLVNTKSTKFLSENK